MSPDYADYSAPHVDEVHPHPFEMELAFDVSLITLCLAASVLSRLPEPHDRKIDLRQSHYLCQTRLELSCFLLLSACKWHESPWMKSDWNRLLRFQVFPFELLLVQQLLVRYIRGLGAFPPAHILVLR